MANPQWTLLADVPAILLYDLGELKSRNTGRMDGRETE